MNWLLMAALAVVCLVSFASVFTWVRRPVEGPRVFGSVMAFSGALLLATSISGVQAENRHREDMAELGHRLLADSKATEGTRNIGRFLTSRSEKQVSPLSVSVGLFGVAWGLFLAFRPRWAMSARQRDLVDKIAVAQENATREWLKTNPKGTGTTA
jgi:hypothetical protein